MNSKTQVVIENGAEIDVPLSKLKKSPKNARKVPHGEAAIEALAASIGAKRMLHPLIVEPEINAVGEPTGFYLVTIGEGRRLAQKLRAKRGEIKKTEPVRCVVETVLDAHEISLDENVTRTDMHPADQYEAFRDLAERKGWGAEEIGARFGVTAQVVRQRLRLGAVSPKLMEAYRAEELTLDHLMAFAVSEDHERQEQVFDQLGASRGAHFIRRAMTETKVSANDRRAVFIGAEAYVEAGGTILRDLFTEDGGGWFEDVALLDRLVVERLEALADQVREHDGWKWAEAHLDYPHGHGMRRVYPHEVERSEEARAAMAALSEEYDALVDKWDAVEELPPEIEARFKEIDAALDAFGDGTAYDADDLSRGGVFLVLGSDGLVRTERGFIRAEDEPSIPEPEPAADGLDGGGQEPKGELEATEEDEDESDGLAPLSERLVLDLTACRTVGLRDALAGDPHLALTATVHALALRTFYPPYEQASCLDIRPISVYLDGYAPGAAESFAGRRIAERHEAWASRLPRESSEAWAFVAALDATDLLALLAHCASLTVNALQNPIDRRPAALAHAAVLASAADLDMTRTWTVTQASYLTRVPKARILEAVAEGVSEDAAERLKGLKKLEMAEAAEQALAGTGWLPGLLRTERAATETAVAIAAE